jgi:hypothetical protein
MQFALAIKHANEKADNSAIFLLLEGENRGNQIAGEENELGL